MGADDDIAASLPQPPPPAPARREAAIDEALRRFDAAGEPSRVPANRRTASPAPWWTNLSRPQAGVLVSAVLVALIGVPAAWMSISHQPATVSQRILASNADSPITMDAVTPEPLAGPSPPPPTDAAKLKQAPVVSPPAMLADGEESCGPRDCAPGTGSLAKASMASPPTPVMELARASEAPSSPPASQVMRTEKGHLALSTREIELADGGVPPPPPAAMPPPRPAPVAAPEAETRAASDMAASSVVVTAQRRAARKPVGRGDWNACTVNDPSRNLSGCKRLVDPGASGPAGRAAARLADGISRAWQGDFNGAVVAFDQAIVIAPRFSFAYLNRGLAYQHRGDLDRAIADLDRAVQYAPGAARGYYNRSLLFRERGDADRASADEDRAVTIDPRYDAVVR